MLYAHLLTILHIMSCTSPVWDSLSNDENFVGRIMIVMWCGWWRRVCCCWDKKEYLSAGWYKKKTRKNKRRRNALIKVSYIYIHFIPLHITYIYLIYTHTRTQITSVNSSSPCKKNWKKLFYFPACLALWKQKESLA